MNSLINFFELAAKIGGAFAFILFIAWILLVIYSLFSKLNTGSSPSPTPPSIHIKPDSHLIKSRFRTQLNSNNSNLIKELNLARINFITTTNSIFNQLYDVYFKVLTVPNALLIIAITNEYFRYLTQRDLLIKVSYVCSIAFYLIGIVLHIILLFLGNQKYTKLIEKIDLDIKNQNDLDKLIQEINTAHQHTRATKILRGFLFFDYILNIIAINSLIIGLLFTLVQ